jgi:hypothetical protein
MYRIMPPLIYRLQFVLVGHVGEEGLLPHGRELRLAEG